MLGIGMAPRLGNDQPHTVSETDLAMMANELRMLATQHALDKTSSAIAPSETSHASSDINVVGTWKIRRSQIREFNVR